VSESEDGPFEPFVVAREDDSDDDGTTDALEAGGTVLSAAESRDMLRRRAANADDPPVRRPPMGPRGPLPGPNYLGAPGRVAIVQGQVFIVGVILIAQLVLCTIALYQLLSGRSDILWWIALASFAGFVIALVVGLWPRRRVRGLD
jgi:hypothetical protein